MISVVGTYQNRFIKLDKELSTDAPVKVIVTFLENIEIAEKKQINAK